MGAVCKGLIPDTHRQPFSGSERGAGLIEVMLAVLVFSAAMAGLLSVQATGLQASAESLQRTTAVLLAQDILARIRANRGELESYVGASLGNPGKRLGRPAVDCDRAACTPPELAAHDLWHWESLLVGDRSGIAGRSAEGLYRPLACILETDGQLTLNITWRGPGHSGFAGPIDCVISDNGLYDDPAQPAGNNLWRRTLVVSTTIKRAPS